MLFYVLHEFLKSFQGEELRNIQRQWFQTVDDILHACVRDMRNIEDGRKRIFKVSGRVSHACLSFLFALCKANLEAHICSLLLIL